MASGCHIFILLLNTSGCYISCFSAVIIFLILYFCTSGRYTYFMVIYIRLYLFSLWNHIFQVFSISSRYFCLHLYVNILIFLLTNGWVRMVIWQLFLLNFRKSCLKGWSRYRLGVIMKEWKSKRINDRNETFAEQNEWFEITRVTGRNG